MVNSLLFIVLSYSFLYIIFVTTKPFLETPTKRIKMKPCTRTRTKLSHLFLTRQIFNLLHLWIFDFYSVYFSWRSYPSRSHQLILGYWCAHMVYITIATSFQAIRTLRVRYPHKLDIANALLHGSLDEICLYDALNPPLVCKLRKSIDALKQGAW